MDPQIFFGTEKNRKDDSHQIEPRWSYYREDPLLHVFYAFFHKIYTQMRISFKWKRANELFLYTHQQMIRRYGHCKIRLQTHDSELPWRGGCRGCPPSSPWAPPAWLSPWGGAARAGRGGPAAGTTAAWAGSSAAPPAHAPTTRRGT